MNRLLKLNNKKHNGLTLIEVLIALTLGLLFIGVVLSFYLSNKKTYRLHESLSRIQESGRFALEFLTRDIKASGFHGCANMRGLLARSPLDPNGLGYDYSQHTRLFGIEAADLENITNQTLFPIRHPLKDLPGDLTIISDILWIQRGSSCVSEIQTQITTSRVSIINNSCEWSPDDIVLMSDCQGSEFAEINSSSLSEITYKMPLSRDFLPGSLLVKYEWNAFFVARNNQVLATEAINTLYKMTRSGELIPLVEGTEQMVFEFGIPEDLSIANNVDRFVRASAVTDWATITSIRINLLIQSIETQVTNSDEGVTFVGKKFNEGKRLRKVFTSTVALRN